MTAVVIAYKNQTDLVIAVTVGWSMWNCAICDTISCDYGLDKGATDEFEYDLLPLIHSDNLRLGNFSGRGDFCVKCDDELLDYGW